MSLWAAQPGLRLRYQGPAPGGIGEKGQELGVSAQHGHSGQTLQLESPDRALQVGSRSEHSLQPGALGGRGGCRAGERAPPSERKPSATADCRSWGYMTRSKGLS